MARYNNAYIQTHVSLYIHTNIQTYILRDGHMYPHANVHTYAHTYKQTYIPSVILIGPLSYNIILHTNTTQTAVGGRYRSATDWLLGVAVINEITIFILLK